ncbi:hypothetical protein HK097_004738, partial [Rhizophlyctis rosea]
MLRMPGGGVGSGESPTLTPVDLFRSDVLAKMREDAAGGLEAGRVPTFETIRVLWEGQSEDVKA